MRNIFLLGGACLAMASSPPAFAQTDTTQPDTQPYLTNQGQAAQAPAAPAGAPAIPSLQDVRSPLNAIVNRPATGAAPTTALAPGARTTFPGTDLQTRIREFEFDQLRDEVQAEQRERNEFQKFVMQSTGRDLPIFGQNLFRAVPSTFAPLDNVPVMSDYVIGP